MLGAETEKRARTRLQRISGMGPGPPPSLGLSPPDNQMWVTEVLPRAARTQCMALIFCEQHCICVPTGQALTELWAQPGAGDARCRTQTVPERPGERKASGNHGLAPPRGHPHREGLPWEGLRVRPQSMPSAQDSPPQGSTTDNCGTLEGRDA
nr:uncharacterized protein LOC112580226 isoform X3 [Bubalus bubalis]